MTGCNLVFIANKLIRRTSLVTLLLIGLFVPINPVWASTDFGFTDGGEAIGVAGNRPALPNGPEQQDPPDAELEDTVGQGREGPPPRFERACVVNDSSISIACETNSMQCDAREGGVLGQWYYFESGEWAKRGGQTCRYPPEPGEDVPDAPTFTLSDFRQLPIAAASSAIQPVPHTLAGAHTNMFADATVQSFNVEVAGYEVEVNAEPVAYKWDYGDGRSLGPIQTPGTQLPRDEWGQETQTSHVYEETGNFDVVLTTLFNGEYSVDGGPWLPIPGEASVGSEPVAISVWRSETHNYADDCLENPEGAGC